MEALGDTLLVTAGNSGVCPSVGQFAFASVVDFHVQSTMKGRTHEQ